MNHNFVRTVSLLSFLILMTIAVFSQKRADSSWGQLKPDTLVKERKNKMLFAGISFINAETSIIQENDTLEYFYKPSLGGGLRLEFYPIKYVGIGIGANYMQRGAGIYLTDVVKTVGDADSTHRIRLRFNTLDFPITLILRSPEIVKGLKISGNVGITPLKNYKVTHIFHSVEDGFHQITDMTAMYYRKDMELSWSIGVDIDAGNAAIFQAHFLGSYGRTNVYSSSFSNFTGKSSFYGVRLSCLF